MGWVALLVLVAVVFMTMPKPQSMPPASFEDVSAPVAKEGKEIPVLFGTKMLRGANVVWYGDFDSSPIKAKGGKK